MITDTEIREIGLRAFIGQLEEEIEAKDREIEALKQRLQAEQGQAKYYREKFVELAGNLPTGLDLKMPENIEKL